MTNINVMYHGFCETFGLTEQPFRLVEKDTIAVYFQRIADASGIGNLWRKCTKENKRFTLNPPCFATEPISWDDYHRVKALYALYELAKNRQIETV